MRRTPTDAPGWEILERGDLDARYERYGRLVRRLVLLDFIRATTRMMAGVLGIALAGSVFYAICPEPIDLLIETVAARTRPHFHPDGLPLGEAPEGSSWVR